MKQMKTIYACKTDEYCLPRNPVDFMEFWTDKIDKIPAKYLSNAFIDMYVDSGDDNIKIEIYYRRDETDEEEKERIQQELRQDEDVMIREKAEYERLKKIYGKNE